MKSSRMWPLESRNVNFDRINITCRCYCSDSYNVTWSGGSVCQVSMYKSAYKLGDCVTVDMNFEECNVPCVQVCSSSVHVYNSINTGVCVATINRRNQLWVRYEVRPSAVHYNTFSCTFHMFVSQNRNTCTGHTVDGNAHILYRYLYVLCAFFINLLQLAVHHKWRLYFEFVTAKDGADAAKTRLNWPIDQSNGDTKVRALIRVIDVLCF